MKILDRLRKSPPQQADDGGATNVPISGYDRLDDKEITDRLSELSQVELAEVEAYERAHANRQPVLDKLRYMRGSEPLRGYDALTPEQVAEALAGADAETVKAVRGYERKFANRRQVLGEAARVLATAPSSAREDRAREEQRARVRDGFADRAKASRGIAADRPAPRRNDD